MRKLVFLMGLLISCSIASAQYESSSVSVGYSDFHMGHTSGLFYNRDGAYIDLNGAWRVPNLVVPLMAGVGISGSGFYDRTRGDFYSRLYSDVGLFSVEGRLSLPIAPTGPHGFFVIPRIGAGLLVDSYAIDTEDFNGFIDTNYHDGAAFEIRPDLEAGFGWGHGAIGADVSYMVAWGDFGQYSSAAQELRAGIFFAYRF